MRVKTVMTYHRRWRWSVVDDNGAVFVSGAAGQVKSEAFAQAQVARKAFMAKYDKQDDSVTAPIKCRPFLFGRKDKRIKLR